MSDLISREALLEALKTFDEKFELQKDDVYDLITNAPAVSGEAVAWIINDGYSKQICINQDVTRTAIRFNWEVTPLYTTPQQPQSVADALEEATNLLDEIGAKLQCNVDSLDYIQGVGAMVGEAEEAIRALIKRNTPKEGE